ncbi:unnamed protein product [Mucor hiemalis]
MKLFKSNSTIMQHPIIVIQDTLQGNISTTDDILNQLQLYQYSTHLKNVKLDRFMQMTNEKDFARYGINKAKDCRRLSLCAQSIRRTSLSSSGSSTTSIDIEDEESKEYSSSPIVAPSDPGTDSDGCVSHLSTPPLMISDFISTTTTQENNEETFFLRENDDFYEENEHQPWPNSIIQKSPPKYIEDHRRYSLPSLVPPEYVDSILDKRRHHSFVEGLTYKSPGEGQEKLPKYTCTVQKMGKAKAKVEFHSPGKRSRRRPWKDVYLELQGTSVKIYEFKDKSKTYGGYHYLPTLTPFYQQPFKYVLLYTLPLADAKSEMAIDYTKRDHVFRITCKDGPQLLFQVQTNVSVSAWVEKLESGSNIAVDLEHQRMPNFTHSLIEPYLGWGSSATRERYQEYRIEELRRRNSCSVDALI